MKGIAAIGLVLLISVNVCAQQITEEAQWRTAYRQSESDISTGRILKWSGVGMLGGGAALAIWGVSSKVPESVNFTETRNTLSINVKEKPRSGAIGAGIGMAVGGFIATAIGVRKMRTGHQRMDELDILGRDRGWRLSTSLRRPEMMLSFNW